MCDWKSKLQIAKTNISKDLYNSTQKDVKALIDSGEISKIVKNTKHSHSVSLRYLLEIHCFSELKKEELKNFGLFCRTLQEMKSIEEIRNTNFYPTTSKNHDALSGTLINEIKKHNIPIQEIEHYCLSGKARIHGFWSPGKVFELLIIDPEHSIHNKQN